MRKLLGDSEWKIKVRVNKETMSSSSSSVRTKPSPGSMRLFVSCYGDRVTMDVSQDQSIAQIKEVVREVFRIGSDEGPAGAEVQERKILSLMYAGSDLNNSWILTDLGILPGSTIKAVLKDEIKPSLFVHCSFNNETIAVFEKINTLQMTLETFRTIVSRKSGLPVSAFRLLTSLDDGQEMFDSHTLSDYGVVLGDTVRLETWDGWTEILQLAIMGFASQLMAQLSSDEIIARFQMKVALHIAAHFGHVDLAVSLMRQGLRADEAVGTHPLRMWCKHSMQHIDCLKAPVHEAADAGQLGVLRSFIHHDVANVLAKDGNGLTPMNISLRRKQKPCASFLLTKQWSKVNYTRKSSIPLSIFCKMKRWCDQAKDTVLSVQGQWKSSVKHPRRHGNTGALIGNGVQLDGYTKSKLSSKPALEARLEEEFEEKKKKPLFDIEEEERRNRNTPSPDIYFRTLGSINTTKLPKLNKLGRILSKVAHEQTKKDDELKDYATDGSDTESIYQSPEPKKKTRVRSRSHSRSENYVRLPPINEKGKTAHKQLSLSHHNLTSGTNDELEFKGNGKIRKSQSLYLKTGTNKETLPEPEPREKVELHTADDIDKPTKKKKKAERPLNAATILARAKHEQSLLASSSESTLRPFMRSSSDDIASRTLSLYEKYRGQKSRDYALKCLSVANSFKDKAWLQQVNQAMVIARRGVKKIVDGQPNIFNASNSFSVNTPRTQLMTPSRGPSIPKASRTSMTTV